METVDICGQYLFFFPIFLLPWHFDLHYLLKQLMMTEKVVMKLEKVVMKGLMAAMRA